MSIRDIGQRHDDAGRPSTLIRRDYAPSLVACVVTMTLGRRVYLANHVGPADVARVLRHLETAHAVIAGDTACYAPACVMAAILQQPDAPGADLSPAVASSA